MSELTDAITVHDARLHNLKHVDVTIPRGQLVAVTGVSGSGKSSLAFGTIHGEGQRRYLESVAPFARRLIGSAMDPQVERIDGLPPTVALEQSLTGGGARSTVGTLSSMGNTLRLLYSRCGDNPDGLYSDAFSPNTPEGMCPDCHGTGTVHEPTESSMVPDPTLSIEDGAIAAWPGAWAGKNFHDILLELGYDLDSPWQDLPAKDREWILFTEERPVVTVKPVRGADQIQRNYEGTWRSVASYLRKTLAETESESLRARTLRFMESRDCPTCNGRRLTAAALAVTYAGAAIDELSALSLADLHARLSARAENHTGATDAGAEELLLRQLLPILESSLDLGLGHLSLDRPAATLSAGELQRVRLGSQLRTGLFGVAYVLDEPSAGLHPSERQAVMETCRNFIAAGNSVLLVEHDMDLVAQCDWLLDVGPGAGEQGGEVLYSGPLHAKLPDTPTTQALQQRGLGLKGEPRTAEGTLEITATANNLDGLHATFGTGQFTVIAGVSGSGKTTLLDALADQADNPVVITQKPIGRTSRSTLATYTGLFDHVRKLFAATPEAKARKWNVSRFSYNVKAGQCATCKGAGTIEIELVFMPGAYQVCPDCQGARYNADTLAVTWQGRTIADVLDLTVDQARDVLGDQPAIDRALETLQAIGLGYLRLGQGAPELSGGEAQRIKLATELQRSRSQARASTRASSRAYLLDEPTTGLHPADIRLLIDELNRLTDTGQTVVVVEHNLSVIAQADHVIEMGPGAGADGGRIIASTTPAQLATMDTATGRCLAASSPANSQER